MPEHDDQTAITTQAEALEALGVPLDSDWIQVRAAYSALLKRLHPDTGGDGDAQVLSKVVDAYRFLSDGFVQSGHAGRSKLFALGELALHADACRERAFACSRLASLGRKSAGAYLQRALFDGDVTVEIAAAKGLGRIRSLAAAESLSAAYDGATEDLREAIISAACEIGPYQCFRELVVKALEDGNPRWRSKALKLYLGMMREERARDEQPA
mgnify:CR=1 FL=1